MYTNVFFPLLSSLTANPAVFISGETQYLLAGMSTDIEASIYANPAPDEVQWLHEGVPVDPASEPLYSILNGGGTLHIEAIDGALFGHYEVVVRVRNQTASDSITLAIPGNIHVCLLAYEWHHTMYSNKFCLMKQQRTWMQGLF